MTKGRLPSHHPNLRLQPKKHGFKNLYGLPTAELWPEAATEPSFYSQIERIRTTGYAFQESSHHIVGYAVPISRDAEVVASLSVYLPSYRNIPDRTELLLTILQQTAERISAKLTGVG